jgi:hypothetical protein
MASATTGAARQHRVNNRHSFTASMRRGSFRVASCDACRARVQSTVRAGSMPDEA